MFVSDLSSFRSFQSDHLFLLVGTNPLPNYVAARLLARQEGTIHLLYSDGSEGGPSTWRFAQFLKLEIENCRSDLAVHPHGLHEASAGEIRRKLQSVLSQESVTGRVGLNYTGGTKAMAVHAYRGVADKFPEATFSYLDARRLAFFIDGVSSPIPIGRALEVSFAELSALHGYEVNKDVRTVPAYEPLFGALAKVHSAADGHQQWYNWRRGGFPKGELPDLTSYPALSPMRQAMDELCDGRATPEALAEKMGFEKFASCGAWFKGKWMEELALAAVIQIASTCNIHEYGASLHPVPSKVLNFEEEQRNFDLDVVAMIGYQLFAISCIDDDRSQGETKRHLLEAYVRARQLGGDEARVALVSCVANPRVLRQEIERDWHAGGQIQVFGRDHLTQLARYFHDWFKRR